jgi:hypothetical protein
VSTELFEATAHVHGEFFWDVLDEVASFAVEMPHSDHGLYLRLDVGDGERSVGDGYGGWGIVGIVRPMVEFDVIKEARLRLGPTHSDDHVVVHWQAEISKTGRSPGTWLVTGYSPDRGQAQRLADDVAERVAEAIPKSAMKREVTRYLELQRNPGRVLALLRDAAFRPSSDGRGLEELVAALVDVCDGLQLLRTRARLAAEEIDLLVANDLDRGFWKVAGSSLLVECKDVAKPIGAAEISLLSEKVGAMGPDSRTGVLVATNGITGDRGRDAVLKTREKRQAGQYLLVLDRTDIDRCVAGEPLSTALERRYVELLTL